MAKEGFIDESKALVEATVHWLRHTGISDDLNKRGRPIVHVRDDAGHTTSATTDLYNDVNYKRGIIQGKRKKFFPISFSSYSYHTKKYSSPDHLY